MKNWINSVISIVAFIISIIAIAKINPTQVIDFDYLGVIIGVLSFLVTLLIGYQIYTVINVKEELKEVRKAREEIDNQMQKIANKLSGEFKEELSNAAPLIMAIASKEKSIIETETFKAYKNSEPNHLSKELAKQAIITYLLGFANTHDENVRIKNLEELSENINYEEAVEFYTDFAKMEDKSGLEDIEPIMLELIGLLSNKK
jgi:uncharacterized membrane protein YgaE (UPF0421/DUF939 family)